MTDPDTRDRLAVLQARLGQPTPRPLEGQQQIPIPEDRDQHQPNSEDNTP